VGGGRREGTSVNFDRGEEGGGSLLIMLKVLTLRKGKGEGRSLVRHLYVRWRVEGRRREA